MCQSPLHLRKKPSVSHSSTLTHSYISSAFPSTVTFTETTSTIAIFLHLSGQDQHHPLWTPPYHNIASGSHISAPRYLGRPPFLCSKRSSLTSRVQRASSAHVDQNFLHKIGLAALYCFSLCNLFSRQSTPAFHGLHGTITRTSTIRVYH